MPEDPGEARDEHRARGDEDRAEHQGAEHAEEQHAVLVLTGYGEPGEDDREHEDVVDGERLSITYPAKYCAPISLP